VIFAICAIKDRIGAVIWLTALAMQTAIADILGSNEHFSFSNVVGSSQLISHMAANFVGRHAGVGVD
jgi:hypothetical protein